MQKQVNFLRSEISRGVSTVGNLSTGKCPLPLGNARGGSWGEHTETSGRGSPRRKGTGLDQGLVKGLSRGNPESSPELRTRTQHYVSRFCEGLW